jgi:aminoglycoside phosphotransferase family enzyme/predicted kinase
MVVGMRPTETADAGIGEILAALSQPSAYPHTPDGVEVVQTHLSCVFLAGDRAYKVKKPVDLGFVDFRTRQRRQWACAEEVRLNAALAPGVYLRVGAITRAADGSLHVDGVGEPVEPVVEMRRLPAVRMLERLLDDGDVDDTLVADLAALLARFHAEAPTGPGVDEFGTPEAVSTNMRENTQQTRAFALERGQPGVRTLSPLLHRFLATRASANVAAHRALLDRRVAHGRIRDGHGDLHAGNICVLPTGIVVYDRIEFAARLRCGDVAADLAFLLMDLDARGFGDLSRLLTRCYGELTGDRELEALLPLYTAYRAAVRGKTLSFAAADPLLGAEEQEVRRRAAVRSFLLAASYDLRPCLVITCGLPAVGKSTHGHAIAASLRAVVLRSDVRRKQMAGLRPEASAAAPFETGIYQPAATRRTYAAMLEDAADAIRRGRSVVVDAAFTTAEQRRPFARLAATLGMPFVVAEVAVPEQVAAARLRSRQERPDVSDADPAVYQAMRQSFEPPTELLLSQRVTVDGQEPGEEAAAAVVDLLVAAAGEI